MKTFNVLTMSGKVQRNKKFPHGVFQVRAESIDNLRRNLAHTKLPKNDIWYYDIWTEKGTPLGTLAVNTFEESIRNQPLLKKYRVEGDRLTWTTSKDDSQYIVNPKTGKLGVKIR